MGFFVASFSNDSKGQTCGPPPLHAGIERKGAVPHTAVWNRPQDGVQDLRHAGTGIVRLNEPKAADSHACLLLDSSLSLLQAYLLLAATARGGAYIMIALLTAGAESPLILNVISIACLGWSCRQIGRWAEGSC